MIREKLPNRRMAGSLTVAWPEDSERRFHISVGFDRSGAVREVFCRSALAGSEIDMLADDACTILSRCLQFGDRLTDISRGLGRLPDGKPASLLCLVVDTARALESQS